MNRIVLVHHFDLLVGTHRSHMGLIDASLLFDHCRRAGDLETAIAKPVRDEHHHVTQRTVTSHDEIVADHCTCVSLRTARIGGHVDTGVRGGCTFKANSAHYRGSA